MGIEAKFGPDDTGVVRIGGPASAESAYLGERVAAPTEKSRAGEGIDLDGLRATRARVANYLNMEIRR